MHRDPIKAVLLVAILVGPPELAFADYSTTAGWSYLGQLITYPNFENLKDNHTTVQVNALDIFEENEDAKFFLLERLAHTGPPKHLVC